MAEDFDCVVLGAGIAGVTAGRDLARKGYRVLVLEGTGAIGGRIQSVRNFVRGPGLVAQTADWPLEAGAEYVHVGNRGRYPQFLGELDWLGFKPRKFLKWGELRGLSWQHGGGRVAFPGWKPPKPHMDTVFADPDIFDTVDLIDSVEDFTGDVNGDDVPVGRYVANQLFRGRGITMGRYALASHTPGILYDQAIEAGCPIPGGNVQDTISVGGLRADNIPAQLKGEAAEYRLETTDGRICGFDTLPARIADELKGARATLPGHVNGEVRLNRTVKTVRRQAHRLKITAAGPGGAVEEFTASAVISTLSVGALLADMNAAANRILDPFWTPAKRAALGIVQMGPISKLAMEFKQRVWGGQGGTTLLSLPDRCSRTFFVPFPGGGTVPFVMTALLTGAQHLRVEALTPLAATAFVLQQLKAILDPTGTLGSWAPEDILVKKADGSPNFLWKNWEADGFARGGVSFIRHGAASLTEVYNAREALKTPEESLPLFWAGEATATAYNVRYQPLCVHGAYISGAGAAEDVHNYLQWLQVSATPADARTGFLDDYRRMNPARAVPPAEVREDVRIDFSPDELAAIRGFAAGQPDPANDGHSVARLVRAMLRYNERPPIDVPVNPFTPTSVWAPLTLQDTQDLLAYAARFNLGNSMEFVVRLLLHNWMNRI